MKIEKVLENNNLTIKIEGRLDTNSITELEEEMSDLSNIESILFDFEYLDYISSSGLRLVLKCKKEIDSTKIINCKPEVYDIFEMTGFAEMMDIEKALRKISIKDCEKIGEGFYGDIYRIDQETIVKVYKHPDSLDMIKREIGLSKRAFVLGIPTAIPYDIVRVGDLYGAVFELLNAKMVVDLIDNEDSLDTFAKKSSEVLKEIHNKEVQDDILPSRKNTLIHILKDCEQYFPKETFNKLNFLLNTIPDSNTLLHCDFHVKNIMTQDDEILLIDMETLSTGHPIFEFGPMLATYEAFSCIDKHNTDKFLGMPLEITKRLFDKTLRYYYNDKNDEEIDNIKQKLSVIAYIQVLKLRSAFIDDIGENEKKEIEFCKNYLIDISEKLDTLNY